MDYAIKTPSQLRPILQGFRKSAGLTQAAVADLLGITQQSYARLEANPAAASVERIFKVMRLLNVDLRLSQTLAAASGESASVATPKRQRSAPAVKKVRPVTGKKKKESW